MTNDTHTDVHLSPHATTVASYGRVPLYKLRLGNLVVADDLATGDALGNPMELVTVANHSRLSRRRGGNTVAGRGGCGRSNSCCGRPNSGGSDGAAGCCASNYTDADVDLSLHARAVGEDTRIPLHEFISGDLVEANNLATGDPLGNPVELVAVFDHAGLGWGRSLHTISSRGGAFGSHCSRGRQYCGLDASDHIDADINFCPHSSAVVKDRRVSLDKFGPRDFALVNDLGAGDVFLDPVELVAIFNHARLRRGGCCHAISWSAGRL